MPLRERLASERLASERLASERLASERFLNSISWTMTTTERLGTYMQQLTCFQPLSFTSSRILAQTDESFLAEAHLNAGPRQQRPMTLC
jgi:hypothetical protein